MVAGPLTPSSHASESNSYCIQVVSYIYAQKQWKCFKFLSIAGSHTMDIGDIIFTLDELQQQYEDVCKGSHVASPLVYK